MSFFRRKCPLCEDGDIEIGFIKAYKTLLCSSCLTRFKLGFLSELVEQIVLGYFWILGPLLILIAIYSIGLAISIVLVPIAFSLIMRKFAKLDVYKKGVGP